MTDQAPATLPCRLCQGTSTRVFEGDILKKYRISYYQCGHCGSLQTERPYWLAEAYAPINDRYDTGQVIRSLMNAAFVAALRELLGFQGRVIDYGCGAGLMVRVLRDIGVDAWGYEPYSLARLAAAFQIDTVSDAALINLCEVVEHFEEPAQALAGIFATQPEAVVIQTALFDKPDPFWPYLGPLHGQHVFFYARGGFQHIAQTFGYYGMFINDFVVLVKPQLASHLVDAATQTLLPEAATHLNQAFAALTRHIANNQYTYAQRDYGEVIRRFEGA